MWGDKVARLEEQVEEARVLRSSLLRRSEVAASSCSSHLGEEAGEELRGLVGERMEVEVGRRLMGRRRREVEERITTLY